MPSVFGKATKQQELLRGLEDVFRTVQREHHLPFGDFPDIERFRQNIQDYDFSKFAKLDLRYVVVAPVYWGTP